MRRKFSLLAILSILITVGLLVAINVADQHIENRLKLSLVNDFSSDETAIGKGVGASIADRFSGIASSMTATSLDANIQSLNPATCNPALDQYYKTANIGVIDLVRVNPQNDYYCVSSSGLFMKSSNIAESYSQKLISDPEHRPVITPEIPLADGKGYAVFIFSPVYDEQHDFLGAIGGAVNLDDLSRDLIAKVRFAQTGHVSVFDTDNNYVWNYIPSHIGKNYFSPAIQNEPNLSIKPLNAAIRAARQGKSQIVTYIGFGGVKKIGSVQSVVITPGYRWIIAVAVPVDEIINTYFRSGLNYAFNAVYVVVVLALLGALSYIIFTGLWSYRLQRTKDQFISLVSHQLRTPLTSIRLFSEMLVDTKVGPLNAKQKEYVDNIQLSTVRMIELVSDILNVSRMGLHSLKVSLKPTDINEFITSQIEEIKPLADKKNIVIKTSLVAKKLELPIDQVLYGQVVHNLLTNAIRYSPSGSGVIEVSLRQVKRGAWDLSVADNGIGIPKEDRKHIFNQFYRAPNAVQAVGEGTGLGLYLVRMVMRATGGDIWFEDRKNGSGTIFHATIPKSGMILKKGVKTL